MPIQVEVLDAPVRITFKDKTQVYGRAVFYHNAHYDATKAWTAIMCNGKDVTQKVKSVAYTDAFYLTGWLTPEIEALGIKVNKRLDTPK